MAYKVVVPSQLGVNEPLVAILERSGCSIERLPAPAPGDPFRWTPELIDRYFRDADAFVGSFMNQMITRDVLAAAPKLRVGVSPIIGTEGIDVDAATELGILIAFGALAENYIGVAEAAVMLIAALLKRLPAKWDATRSGGWRVDHPGAMVRDHTIGIVGLGQVGKATARRLAGWECRLIGSDPYVDARGAAEVGVELVDLETLLRTADVVSLSVTLTDQTRGMIGEREFRLMKPGAYFVNTARGACIDEAALIRALQSGHLAGAGIDAWSPEPAAPDNPLRTLPNVITTGHNIAHSQELYERMPPVAAENTLLGLRGEEPLHVRNPEVLPRWRERLARLGVTPVRA